MLAAVTCIFNPHGYKNIIRNYFTFRRHYNGPPLYTVELSFTGNFECPDAEMKLLGNDSNFMWQKERLLNILIESLPDKVDRIAWIDADVLFMNPQWEKGTEEALEQFPVVQLFSAAHVLDSFGRIVDTHPGYCHLQRYPHLGSLWGRTGYAWAARREAIPGGLMDDHILGSGDLLMAEAWHNQRTCAQREIKNVNWYRRWDEWAKKYYTGSQGRLGFVWGDVVHLFHGDYAKRQYVPRLEIFQKYDYDPFMDIRKDHNGVWVWNSEKPGMHKAIKDYFSVRDEDGVSSLMK